MTKSTLSNEFKDFLDSNRDDFEEAAKQEKGARVQLPPIGATGEAALMSIRGGISKDSQNPYVLFNFVVQEPEEYKGSDSATVFTLASNSMFTKQQSIQMMFDTMESWGLPRDIRETGDIHACIEWFEEGLIVDYKVAHDSNKKNEQGRKLVCSAQNNSQAKVVETKTTKAETSKVETSKAETSKAETTKPSSSESSDDKPPFSQTGLVKGQVVKYDKKEYTFDHIEGDNVILISKLGRERAVPISELE
jgi:hypothetical protein